ncbi:MULTISPECIES: hypothetical protein [unclassified Micromonospora]|uniref:hypothetical protein n=1 Tax=unclassified Micromonospora TaxID=2617518 RepID=UPI0033219DD2
MPAVALTCPLWWVARWAARLLAGLAVAVAFAVGAGALPAASPTQVGAPSIDTWVPPADALAPPAPALPAPALPVTLAPVDPRGTVATVAVVDHRAVADPCVVVGRPPVDRAAGAVDRAAGAVDRAATGPGHPAAPADPAGAVAPGPAPAPAGRTPGAAGPRGPPRG